MDNQGYQRIVTYYVNDAIRFGEVSREQIAESLNLTLSELTAKLCGAKDWTFENLVNLYFIGVHVPGLYPAKGGENA